MVAKDLFDLQSQYYCSGDPRSQGISGNCIDLVISQYSSLGTRHVNIMFSSNWGGEILKNGCLCYNSL